MCWINARKFIQLNVCYKIIFSYHKQSFILNRVQYKFADNLCDWHVYFKLIKYYFAVYFKLRFQVALADRICDVTCLSIPTLPSGSFNSFILSIKYTINGLNRANKHFNKFTKLNITLKWDINPVSLPFLPAVCQLDNESSLSMTAFH